MIDAATDAATRGAGGGEVEPQHRPRAHTHVSVGVDDRTIHRLIADQVARTPHAVAVADDTGSLSYRALDARATLLAQHLRALGVGPDVLTGLCVTRSLDMLVGLLGILKAGGAYVPLDPAYPAERLAFMLRDAQVAVLVTQDSVRAVLPPHADHTVDLDQDWPQVARQQPDLPLTDAARADNLAYVIYTSGSTGQPKGVLISHRTLVHSTRARWTYYEAPVERFALLSSLAFDSSVAGVFWTLSQGGAICLPSPDVQADPRALAAFIARQRISHLLSVPALYAQLVTYANPTALRSLRTVIVAGDECPADLVRAHHERLPWAALFNEYGPTEGTVWSTVHACRPEPEPGPARIPIGRPIADVAVYLLDAQGQPVSAGAVGEVYIGGAGVAYGYLNRPALTAARFLPDPFAAPPHARMYRTGDLARALPDGALEFLGRVDQQVKIRGHRIEVGEIEVTLGQHPSVQRGIVVAREDRPGEKRLAAYVVPRSTPPSTAADLRAFLAARLPSSMVPLTYTMLDALPLTPNGKVDRLNLPTPTADATEAGAPQTRREVAVAAIWSRILGHAQLDREATLDELGVDSLQATCLALEVSHHLDREISTAFLLEHPTVARLASALDNLAANGGASHRPHGSDGEGMPIAPPIVRAGTLASPWVRREQRSLLTLIASGKIAPVEAVALDYLQSSLLQTGLGREEISRAWCGDLPLVHGVIDTALGRLATIILPVWDSDLYGLGQDLTDTILDALHLAAHLGARTVSLTGLLPSATDYGRTVAAAVAGRTDLPAVTTGHGTTAAAIALAVRRILRDADRTLGNERVGMLGLGSIGQAALRLLVRGLPHPAEITLCDVYKQRDALEEVAHEIRAVVGPTVPVRVMISGGQVPPDFYAASLIIGATNVPAILDIAQVRPGTLIVDDSAPHCFAPARAVERLRERGDILFTEGGALRAPTPLSEVIYLPPGSEEYVELLDLTFCRAGDPYEIMGCELSSLLSVRYEDLRPTIGLVDVPLCLRHYEVLDRLGFEGARLYCDAYTLPSPAIHAFRRRFSNDAMSTALQNSSGD